MSLRRFERLRVAIRLGSLATALAVLPSGMSWAAGPAPWSLQRPTESDPWTGWGKSLPARPTDGALPMLPDPTDDAATTAAQPPQDFSVAPSVDNILNRRHDLSEEQMGEPGGSGGYLRSVGRTFGLALKKALY
jgi:hypothetical protein